MIHHWGWYTRAHTRVGGSDRDEKGRNEGDGRWQEGGGRQGRQSKIASLGVSGCHRDLRHFPPFSPAWPVKCAAIGGRLSQRGDALTTLRRATPSLAARPSTPANPVYIDFSPVQFYLPSLIVVSRQVSPYHRDTDTLSWFCKLSSIRQSA